MFKKKVWKRGDKLNAKELNRIEEGIAAAAQSGGAADEAPDVLYVTADEDVTDMAQGADHIVFSNWSVTPEELNVALSANKKICLKLNVFQVLPQTEILTQIGVYYIDSFSIIDGTATFILYIENAGWFEWNLTVPKNTDEINFTPTSVN